MKRSILRVSFVLLVGLTTMLTALPAIADQQGVMPIDQPPVDTDGPEYFAETGFWVDAEFMEFWNENGGLTTFGYPITRVFYQDGLHRQYFQRAIFEHHEMNEEPFQVLLLRIGMLNTIQQRKEDEPFQPVRRSDRPSRDATFYPETGHFLDGIFQEYWQENGGVAAFGYPLSEPFRERDESTAEYLTVQYFERARMEHHLEYVGTESEIMLGHLGSEALGNRIVPEIAVTPQGSARVEGQTPPVGPRPLYDDHQVSCGFNMAFWGNVAGQDKNAHYLDMLAETGCTWVRFQFAWYSLQPEPDTDIVTQLWAYDQVINMARDRELQVLVNITHAPDWAEPYDLGYPAHPEAFESFVSDLVSHFAGRVDAWQIWNEPNLIDENNGQINPAGYLALARVAYPAVKQADPSALVVFPGLAPTSLEYDDWALDDDEYLETLFSLNDGEIIQYFDIFGAQGYGAGNSPDNYWPGNPPDKPDWTQAAEFYFRHVEDLHRVLVMAGAGDKPVWITESGWPTPNPTFVYGYGAWITPELQAEYLTRAYEIVRTEWDWVDAYFVWHLNIAPYAGKADPFSGFSIIDHSGAPRPAYYAIKEMVGGNGGIGE